MKPMTVSTAKAIYDATYEDYYSGRRYGKRQWRFLIEILGTTYTADQVKAIMQSKWVRLAADQAEDPDHPTAEEAIAWLSSAKGFDRRAVEQLTY